jgi:hypothetical protein
VGDHLLWSVDSPSLGDDGATICEVSHSGFSVDQLGALVGYIRRPFNEESVRVGQETVSVRRGVLVVEEVSYCWK